MQLRTLIPVIAILLFISVPAKAQGPYPNGFELLCPAGSQPIPQNNTWNPSTQRWRANVCIDANGNITFQGAAILPAGSVSNPSLTWTNCLLSAFTCGFFLDAGGRIAWGGPVLGVSAASMDAIGGDLNFSGRQFGAIAWWDTANFAVPGGYTTGTIDIRIGNDVNTCTGSTHCGFMGQIGDMDPQQYVIYNTLSTTSNFERLRLGWNANIALVSTEQAGSGILRPLHIISSNCISSVGTCGTNTTGLVTIGAGVTFVTVATSEVRASSIIKVQFDESIGAALGVTCNTGAASESATYFISARTVGTSFVIKTSSAPSVNPACLSYAIVN